MELLEFELDRISDEAIRDKYVNGSQTSLTHHFVAVEQGRQVGFVAIDFDPDAPHLVIYKIFVPTALRRRGIGTRILKAAEAVGRVLGYRSALLIPKTLDPDFPQADLEEWYRRNGYKRWVEHAANGHLKELQSGE